MIFAITKSKKLTGSANYTLNINKMTIQASNDNLWVIREPELSERSGIIIPDSAKKKAHRGKIITYGELVSDPKVKLFETAIFNKSAGFEIEEEGETYLILKQMDVIGYDKRKR